MKKLLTIMLALLLSSVITAHKQQVHQYLTMEAYKLLKMQLGGDVRMMKDRLGDWTSYYIGDRAWQRGYITTGAYREDEEDVVYGYSKSSAPTITGTTGILSDLIAGLGGITPDPFVSITHFWSADQGDVLSTTMRIGVLKVFHNAGTLTVPSAYQKFIKLATPNRSWVLRYSDGAGGHQFTFNKAGGGTVTFDWNFYLGIEYNSLIEMFKTGRAWIVGYYNVNTEWIDSNRDSRLPCEVVLGAGHKEWFVWEILGRMCHLLQDMTVPAHTNLDPHGNNPDLIEDYYENSFEWTFDWNYQNTFSQVGGYINPYQSSNPLHFLMYTTNQMSNHFATQGPHYEPPNDYFSGNPLPEEINYLNSLNVSSFGAPTSINGPFDQASIDNVRNHLFTQAIRATAGLLYWFAKEADLLPIPLTSVSLSGDFTLYQGGTGNWYVTLGNGLEPFTYQWEIMYLDGVGYLQNYESVKKEKEKKDKEKNKDGGVIIYAAPSNEWVPVGTNSLTFSKPFNPYDLRSFKLRCTVRDGGNTTKVSNEFYVDVVNTPPPQASMVADNNTSNTMKLEKENVEVQAPSSYLLNQNYPNPFNPSTKISYSLPEANFVTLKVYDMLGREVSTLVNEMKPAGTFEAEFDASRLSSGTYVYKLTAGGYQTVKKMILTK